MPEIAPPPLGLVGPVEVPPDPPALLLPNPVFGLTLGVDSSPSVTIVLRLTWASPMTASGASMGASRIASRCPELQAGVSGILHQDRWAIGREV